MLFALGAASSVLDALQSLATTKSSSSQPATSTQNTANPFDVPDSSATTSGASSTTTGAPGWSRISPETMSALLAAQSQSSDAAATTTTSTTSPSNALQDLFSQIDANGDGQISKSEFENALGAGGTNVAQADDVFGKLDQNGDGNVSLDEMKQALQGAGGHHGGHHHAHAAAASGQTSADGTSADGTSSTDPLQQLLNAQTASTSQSGTNLTSPYNFIDQLLQSQSQNFASASSTMLSV
jgi:Ca2+-binding EF-hand superfamily protein